MRGIEDGMSKMWEQVFEWLPQLLAALIILIVTYIVAKIFQAVFSNLLSRLNFDARLHSAQGGRFLRRAIPRPSQFVGHVIFWLLFLGGLGIALSSLGIPLLNDIISGIYGYLPHVFAALLIFLIASGVSGATNVFINRTLGDTPTGRVSAAVVPVVIMSVATFMILEQLQIAPSIVTITYTGLVGSLFLGLALAFGLGGRDVAATILQKAYQESQKKESQIHHDIEIAKKRVKKQKK